MSDVESKKACLGCDYDRNIVYIEGIMDNVLSRLTVKDVLKCKSVSKLWYSLINGPQFTKLHFSRSLEKNLKFVVCLYDDDDSQIYLIEPNGSSTQLVLSSIDHNYDFKMISSFNGLIIGTDLKSDKKLDILIINPAIREFQVLPDGSPSELTPSVGVVFDPENYRYKILRFYSDTLEPEDGNYKCEVYVPDTQAWRRVSNSIQCPKSRNGFPLCPSHVCVGGRMYWLVWGPDGPVCVVSVDMEENFTRIKLPEYIIPGGTFDSFTFLAGWEDRLILIAIDDTGDILVIWSLQVHDKSIWFFEGTIDLKLEGINTMSSIITIKNGILLVIKPFCYDIFDYYMINLSSMTWKKLWLHYKFRTPRAVALPFVESLFSVI
ncbi:hypothetical protein ACJIZ3_012704 [Penstemon smallii]|uniref:F-box domain-containing protein n=1 Tax=Penstemon smallii TaxID=265156 RepID=A0ABD3URE1_9LAMI